MLVQDLGFLEEQRKSIKPGAMDPKELESRIKHLSGLINNLRKKKKENK
jgi:hypothetical protein